MKKIISLLFLLPSVLYGQSITSKGNETIYIKPSTIVSSVGGISLSGSGTNTFSIPSGTSLNAVSPASERVLVTNPTAKYQVRDVATNQTANFYLDLMYSSAKVAADVSIVNKSAVGTYDVSLEQKNHIGFTAIPVQWTISRLAATTNDVNDLNFTWGNALEPNEIANKRLFIFNATLGIWDLLPEANTSINETTNTLTYTGFTGKLEGSKFMIAEASKNANLYSLTISAGTLSPAFDPENLIYEVLVPQTTTNYSFTPTLSINQATLRVNGVVVTSGALYSTTLSGNTTVFSISVTSMDGSVTKNYTLRVLKTFTSVPTPTNPWVNLFTGARFDPNDDQQATSDTDILGNAVDPMTQAQQSFVSINGTTEKVYYFRVRLANAIRNNGASPSTSFYYAIDINKDQKVDLVVEANAKSSIPFVAYHMHDPSKDGSGPSKTAWLNSTTNLNIERKLANTASEIRYYATTVEANNTSNLDLDAPVGGANTGNDTWLEFAFTESSFKSFTRDALGVETSGGAVSGLVAFTSTSQTANGDIGGINDKTANLNLSWAELGVMLTSSFEDVTVEPVADPMTVDVISTKSLNGDARIFGVWNGEDYPNSVLTVTTYEPGTTTVKETFTYNNATATANGLIATTGYSWYIDVTNYAAGLYPVKAVMTDASANPNTATGEGTLLITSVKINDLITDDTTPTLSGTSDRPAGTTVTIDLYKSDGIKVGTYTTTTLADGTWSFTIPNPITVGTYDLSAEITVGTSVSKDEIELKIVDSPRIDIGSNLVQTYGSTILSGTTNQTAVRTVDLVLTNSLGEELTYTVQTDASGNWTFDLKTLPAGSYQIYVSVLDGNGIRVGNQGILTVNKKSLVISAVNKTKIFGEVDPSLTATYNGFVNNETTTALSGTLVLSRVSGETAGDYVISASGYTSNNYDISYVSGKLSITKKSISASDITVADITDVVYNGLAHEPLPKLYDRGSLLSLGTQYTISSYANNTNVGEASITIAGTGNFDGTRVIKFNITKAPLTVTAEDKTKVYGAQDPTFTVSYTGFVNNETATSLGVSPTISRASGENVGNYTITPSNVSLSNYDVSYQTAKLSITGKSISSNDINVSGVNSLTYNGLAQTQSLVLTDTSFDPDKILISGTDYTLSYTNNTNVGTATITITGLGNYSGVKTETFAITKATLTVTAENKNKTYGASDPELTLTYSGFVNGETAAVLGGTLSLSRASGETINTYAITASGYTSSNYSISYVPGVFSITAKPFSSLDISVSALSDVVYTGLAQNLKPNVYDNGTLLTEGTDYDLSYSASTNVGTVTVTITAKGAYSGTKTTTYAIIKAPLSIKADDKTKIFGASDPTLTVTYTGFVNNETNSVLTGSLSISRTSDQNVGVYATSITASGFTSSNYDISYPKGTFTITQRAITSSGITVATISDLTYTGLAQTPSPTVVDGTTTLTSADYTLSYSNNTNVGTATITITGKGNYSGVRTITFKIVKAALTVTAEAKSKTFGAADPSFTVTYSGFVNNETATVLGGALSFTRVSGEAVGTYAISPSGYTSGNYSISYVTADLSITAKDISTATDISIEPIADVVYKGADYLVLPIVKDGNSLLVKDTDYTLTYSNNKNAGTATVTVTGAGNYTGVKSLNFTISKAPLTITADNKSKLTGQADPTFTVTYTGFVASETASVLTGTLSLTRASGEARGDYDITASGYNATQTNYILNYVKGTLTISGTDIAGASITVDPIADLTYDGTAQTPPLAIMDTSIDPDYLLELGKDYTLSYSNNIDAGTASVLITGKGSYFGTRIITFKILPKTLTVTADNKTKVYGEKDPEFSYAISGYVTGESLTISGVLSRAVGETVANSPYDINLGNLAISDNGSYKASNYKLVLATGKTLTINKATLTVNVNDDAKFVGQNDATGYAGVSYSGFVFGEDASSAGITGLTITRSNFGDNAAGVYTGVLSAANASAANYDFTYATNGKYTIVAADQLLVQLGNTSTIYGTTPTYTVASSKYLKITKDANDNDVYTITDLTNSTVITGTTVKVNEVINSVSTETASFTIAPQSVANSTSNNLKVGSYTIAPGTVTGSSPNFNNTIVLTGTLTVKQKELKPVVSGGTSKVYDGKFPMDVLSLGFDPTNQASFSPYTNDIVTANGTGVYTTKDVGSSDYTVSNMSLSGTDAANYYISGGASATIAGTGGQITARPLTVTPIPNQSKTFGASDPTLIYTYSNNVDGETPGFTGVLTRDSGETKGEYNILLGNLALADNSPFKAANYSLNFTPNVKFNIINNNLSTSGFSVNAIPSLVYNGLDQTPSVVVNDLSTNPISQLSASTDYDLSYSSNKNVGTATVTITGKGNYTGLRTATFQITKAPLTVTANNLSKGFGESDPTLTVSYAGFVATENASNVTASTALVISRQAGENIGSYVITPSALAYANYELSFVKGLLTIGAKDLSTSTDFEVSSISDQVYKGFAQTPSLTITDKSFDPVKTLVLSTDYTLTYADNINVGQASVTITGKGNYSGSRTVNFNITKAPLSVIADDKTITFGEPIPTLTATYTGFVNGETSDALPGRVVFPTISATTQGVYPITLTYIEPRSVISSGNYQLSFTDGDLTVGTKDISSSDITVSTPSDEIYTGAAHSPEPTVKDGITTLIKGTDYTLSYSADNINVGQVTITVVGQGNYSGSRTVIFNIKKAILTVTAENKTKVFGEADPSYTATYVGFVTNESAVSLSVAPSFTRASGTAVGIYDITPSGVTLSNYDAVYVKGTLAITAKSLNATGISLTPPANVAYTGLAHNLLPVVKDGSTTLVKDTDYTLSYSPNINVGTVTISITGKGNYSGTISTTFAITPVNLTITAENKTKVYGAADPAFTVTYSGFVNSENETRLGGALAFSRAPGEIPADYTITPSGYTSGNYTISFVNGKLTIDAKPLSSFDITVAPIADLIYKGSAYLPSPTVKDGASTLIKDVDFTLSYSNNTNAGTASITLTGIGNYTGTKTVNFIIKKAPLTIKAVDNAKVFGSADPILTVSYSGFVASESETSTPAVFTGTLSVTRSAGDGFGIYPITASGLIAANYQISYVPGVFSISSKLISSSDVVISGLENKVYTGIAQIQSALLLKDGAHVMVEGTDYSLIYTNNIYVGTANISISGIGDYSGMRNITFQINKAPLTITADNLSKTFGAADPALTVSYSNPGFVNNETAAVLGGKLEISRAEGETANSYVITPSGYSSNNYDITFTPGTFTINTKAINANDISVANIPSVSYRGTVYEPELTIVDAAGNKTLIEGTDYTLAYSDNLNAGTATVTISGIGNYSGSRTKTFVINPTPLRISADNATKVFGQANPSSFTVSYDGFVNGETNQVLNSGLLVSRVSGEDVGDYVITPSGYTSTNYDITFVPGTFTITSKAINATDITIADILAVTYRGTAYELKPILTDAEVNKTLTENTDYTLTYTNNVNAGTATITITGIGNYSGSRNKTFVINKAPLTVTALDKFKVFGENDPAFEITYTGFVNGEDEDDLLKKPSINREVGENADSYEITPSGALSNNYIISYTTANLTISTKDISDINSPDIFVGVISNLTYTGLAQTPVPTIIDLGNALVYERDFNLTFVNNINVGKVIVTITGIGNYIGSRTIEFDIVKARLEVKADNKIKTFGAADPELTASYTGFVNGETIADLGGSLTITRDPGETNGNYSISVSGWTSSNYEIVFAPGTFTIGTKDISSADITVSSIADVIYTGLTHSPAPTLEDGGTTLQNEIDYKLSYSPNINAGTVTVTIDGNNNYSGSRTVNFEIKKAELSITAKDNEKVFGEVDPNFEVDYLGFVNGESQADLSGSLRTSREQGEAAGNYVITPSGFESNNYSITFNTGTFTINTKDLSSADISVESIADLIYKGTPHTPEPLMKDRAVSMILNTDYTLTYTNNLQVGRANVVISGIGNYSGSISTSFEIVKKLLTISVNNNSKLIGSADPILTVSYTGFVADETPADLGGKLIISREPGEEMGTYIISVEGYTSSNYDIVFKNGTFVIGDSVAPTIVAKDIAIELDDKGQANIQVSDIDNGTFDAGGISARTLSKTSFNCSNVGINSVEFTVTDNNFNVSTATVTVTVINNAPDTDSDGLKDNCDDDDDSDGVSDVQELIDGTNTLDLCSFKLSSQNLSPSTVWNNVDCDGDGVSNGQEVKDGTNPLDGCVYKVANQIVANVSTLWSNQDCDSDGLTNGEELTGIDNSSSQADPKGIKTSPLIKDSDGDGASDGDEALDGTNPNDSCSYKLTSQKLAPSLAWNNADCDGDGVTNGNEKADGTNSLSNCDLKVSSRTLQPDAAWKNGDCDNDGLTNEADGVEDCDKDGKENFIDFDVCRIDILMASVFTPNGDGINDELKPVLLGIEKFVCFKVYNRWGNLIFETKDRDKGWDGNFGTSQQATETFQWLSEGYDRDGILIRRTGTVTLLR